MRQMTRAGNEIRPFDFNVIKIRSATLLDTHQLKAYKASKVLNLLTLPSICPYFSFLSVCPLYPVRIYRTWPDAYFQESLCSSHQSFNLSRRVSSKNSR